MVVDTGCSKCRNDGGVPGRPIRFAAPLRHVERGRIREGTVERSGGKDRRIEASGEDTLTCEAAGC